MNGKHFPQFEIWAGAGAVQWAHPRIPSNTSWWPGGYIPQPIEEREVLRRKILDPGKIAINANGRFSYNAVFRLSGQVRCDRPHHFACMDGDARNSTHFSGFKFYDRNGNLLPPGSYSAIGEDGIDWSIPNVPQQVGTVAVLSSGFEDPILNDGKRTDPGESNWNQGTYVYRFAPGDPRDWMPGSNALGNEAGVWNPDPSDGFTDGAAFAGENNAWATSTSSIDTGLSQVLDETLQADTDYLLSVQVGNPLVNDRAETAPYRIELLAGGAVLNSVTGNSPAAGSWQLGC